MTQIAPPQGDPAEELRRRNIPQDQPPQPEGPSREEMIAFLVDDARRKGADPASISKLQQELQGLPEEELKSRYDSAVGGSIDDDMAAAEGAPPPGGPLGGAAPMGAAAPMM